MTAQIQVRRDLAATWTTNNPTLKSGEFGFESDTGAFKIGDGDTSWTSLMYSGGKYISYTPTLAQGASTDIAKTVTYAKYVRTLNNVLVNVKVAATATGTASSAITLSLPVTAATSGLIVGSGSYFVTGANEYRGPVLLQSTTTVSLLAGEVTQTTNNVAFGVAPAITVASGDIFNVSFQYEAA